MWLHLFTFWRAPLHFGILLLGLFGPFILNRWGALACFHGGVCPQGFCAAFFLHVYLLVYPSAKEILVARLCAERIFKILKRQLNQENHHYKGLAKVTIHACITLMCVLAVMRDARAGEMSRFIFHAIKLEIYDGKAKELIS